MEMEALRIGLGKRVVLLEAQAMYIYVHLLSCSERPVTDVGQAMTEKRNEHLLSTCCVPGKRT